MKVTNFTNKYPCVLSYYSVNGENFLYPVNADFVWANKENYQ